MMEVAATSASRGRSRPLERVLRRGPLHDKDSAAPDVTRILWDRARLPQARGAAARRTRSDGPRLLATSCVRDQAVVGSSCGPRIQSAVARATVSESDAGQSARGRRRTCSSHRRPSSSGLTHRSRSSDRGADCRAKCERCHLRNSRRKVLPPFIPVHHFPGLRPERAVEPSTRQSH